MITKKDLQLLATTFVTKAEFAQFKNEFAEFKNEFSEHKDEMLTRFDAIMVELQAIRQDQAALTYRVREHSDQLEALSKVIPT